MSLLVSVVTPCFNSAKSLEATIRSVMAQTYTPIEYIVVDGGSTDSTLDILRKCQQEFGARLTFISEPDRGQSDAINKGWRRSHGEVLAWLNADDLYLPASVQTAVEALAQHSEAQWVYGLGQVINAEREVFPFRHPVFSTWRYENLLDLGCVIMQPAVFLRKEVIDEFGFLKEDLHYAMDYEYWLRIGRKFPGLFVPSVLAQIEWYPDTKTASGGVRKLAEVEAVARTYGAADLPSLSHHEWAAAYFVEFVRDIRQRHWRAAGLDLRAAVRYPNVIPRALGKQIFKALVPPRLETRIRQVLLRSYAAGTRYHK